MSSDKKQEKKLCKRVLWALC